MFFILFISFLRRVFVSSSSRSPSQRSTKIQSWAAALCVVGVEVHCEWSDRRERDLGGRPLECRTAR